MKRSKSSGKEATAPSGLTPREEEAKVGRASTASPPATAIEANRTLPRKVQRIFKKKGEIQGGTE
ncbi:MAG: hypothetical protein ACRDL7_07375 [Gaiellaceae bacterium]